MKPVSIKEVLADYDHPLHEPVMDALVDLELGVVSLCACLGAQYGEPYCPCKMEKLGLPPSEARLKAVEEAKASWELFCKSEALDELMSRNKGSDKSQAKPD